MIQNIDLSTILFLFIITLSAIRLFKKILHIAILLIPPLILSNHSNLSFITLLIIWFVITDFLANNYKDINNLINTLFISHRAFKYSLIGKILNILGRAFSLFLIISSYLYFLNSIFYSGSLASILTSTIYTFISISIIKIITAFALKQSLFKIKKGA